MKLKSNMYHNHNKLNMEIEKISESLPYWGKYSYNIYKTFNKYVENQE